MLKMQNGLHVHRLSPESSVEVEIKKDRQVIIRENAKQLHRHSMLVDMLNLITVLNTVGEFDSFFFQKNDPSWPWKLTRKDMSPDSLV